MSIKITPEEYIEMQRQLIQMPARTLIRLLNDLVFTAEYPVLKYTYDNINRAFKNPAEAVAKLKDVEISESDYFWTGHGKVVVIDKDAPALKVFKLLGLDTSVLINALQLSPDVAEEYGIKITHITEYSVYDFIENNLYLIPVEKLAKFLKNEMVSNNLIGDFDVVEDKEGKPKVWVKENTLDS